MIHSLYLEVEENDNCDYMPMQLYEAQRDPVPVATLNLAEPGRPAGIYTVTGWSSQDDGTPCPAMYVPVSDSGQGIVHLVFGGNWGIRVRPVDSDQDWDLDSPDQWGEPYLMLIDGGDVIFDP